MADELDAILEEARALGFLGPGPVTPQRAHAEAFVSALGDWTSGPVLDLGSGGGLPGLVLAGLLPATSWVLLDAMHRRTTFLQDAVVRLGWTDRVRVVTGRAEEAGRDPLLRQRFDRVVVRSFGPPAVTAECAAPLVHVGGAVVVSEPPGSTGTRWPSAPLRQLGLTLDEVVVGPPAFVRLRARTPVSDAYPRRTGQPAKRPLW